WAEGARPFGPQQVDAIRRLLAGHGREVLKELRERFPGFEVVEHGANRRARAGEAGRAAEDVGVAVNDGNSRGHGSPRQPFHLVPIVSVPLLPYRGGRST